MQTFPPTHSRELKTETFHCDLTVIGGGMAGTCCAITAARAGLKVVLVQDRPVLGGNASSEVRLWTLGATSHMGNNNRWSREGGVLDEILVENMWRNPEGNALIFDTVLLDKVVSEPNLTLLLNTAMLDCKKRDADHIESVRAFCSQNSTMYEIHAPLFCDASGDGVLGFLAGAAFRMGAESCDEFDEAFAPDKEYGELLGHSIYFYSKDVGRPVEFIPPSYALDDIKAKIPRFRNFNASEYGCRLWWIEYGGRLDTIHQTENIKWELWKVVYGVWNYIKNSGEFPDAQNLTLEWVGQVPGKRESRRFEGDYILNQRDLVEQRQHHDAVAFGGWSLDLHPADGVFSEKPGCTQWHSRGAYQIPYRCLYSRNISNLFLAGRIISSSHVAFASTRVMATLAHAAQAVGIAASLCHKHKLQPRDLSDHEYVSRLQTELLKTGQHVPHLRLQDRKDLAQQAQIVASSELQLSKLSSNNGTVGLEKSRAQLLPLSTGRVSQVTFTVESNETTTLELQLRVSEKRENFTPDRVLASQQVGLSAGTQQITTNFDVELEEPCYGFYCLMQNENVKVHTSDQRLSGVLSLTQNHQQNPPENIGVEAIDFWLPSRRPGGKNFAVEVSPPLDVFGAQNVTNGLQRPTTQSNVWLASLDDKRPTLTLRWDNAQTVSRIELFFDPDYDHPMESVLMGHPERAMPFCVKHYQVLNDAGNVVYENCDNHQARNSIVLDNPVTTSELHIELLSSHGDVPAALFEVRCYSYDNFKSLL